MSAVVQLDLLSSPVPDPTRDAILALVAGDPCHERDRAAIVDAIRDAVRWDGTVSANAWRDSIPSWVNPRVVGATVHALTTAGVLIPTGQWERSTDLKGRNSNKPCMTYLWKEPRP